MIDKPYNEEIIGGFNIRKFSSSLDESELKWHYDEEDRIVICEHDTDWFFQNDNEMPQKIEKNKPIFITKDDYHRLIKGSGDIILKIKKL